MVSEVGCHPTGAVAAAGAVEVVVWMMVEWEPMVVEEEAVVLVVPVGLLVRPVEVSWVVVPEAAVAVVVAAGSAEEGSLQEAAALESPSVLAV